MFTQLRRISPAVSRNLSATHVQALRWMETSAQSSFSEDAVSKIFTDRHVADDFDLNTDLSKKTEVLRDCMTELKINVPCNFLWALQKKSDVVAFFDHVHAERAEKLRRAQEPLPENVEIRLKPLKKLERQAEIDRRKQVAAEIAEK